jgi:hypothetical protein
VTRAVPYVSAGQLLDTASCRSVKLQQRCWLDERAKLRDPAPTHEQRGQAEYDAILCREIRSTLSGAIANEQLMLQQQRLCGNGTDATRAEQLRECHEKVDR